MIIDAHQHFWQPERGDYGWLTPELTSLYRDFMPSDLKPHLIQHGIDGTLLVQAAPTPAETAFMLEIAASTPFVLGVVGWADFADADAADTIATLALQDKLVGLRPMIQDIADDDWMLRADLTPAFEAMVQNNLTFDALVLPRHLTRLKSLLARHPDLRCVIDHGAKPDIANGVFQPWADDMADLAQNTTAYCKLSGLLTEASADWTPSQIAPYVEHLFAQFGAGRLIWGSDWPVLTLAAGYEAWHDLARSYLSGDASVDAIFGGNAASVYGLTVNNSSKRGHS